MKNNALPKVIVLLVALSLLVIGKVFAGPPFVTDDPEPVDYQHWEFYIASINAKSHSDWSGTAPHFEVNYGAISNLQLHLIAPLAYDDPADGPSHYGIGDIELGAKYRFIEETNWIPQAGVFPLVQVPSGNAANNLGTGYGHWQAYFPLWLQKSWGKWTAYGGGGYGVNSVRGHDNWHFEGGVLQNQVTSNLLVGVEVYHQSAAQADFPNVGTAFNVGTVYDFTDNYHLLFSAGRSIDGPVGFQCYLAFQFTFDNGFFHGARNEGEEKHPAGSR